MKRSALFGLVGVLGLTLSGCMAVHSPTVGALFTDTKYSYDHVAGTSGSKTGRACSQAFLGLVAIGDSSVAAAKVAGGIGEVTDITHEAKNYLGAYAEHCTIVRGR